MMNNNIHFNTFETKVDLVDKLSQSIAKNLQDAINKNGSATLIVSGGSTPKPLFEKLRKIEIEWKKVKVGLCDERWVSPSHDDSNEKLVKSNLLQEKASKAEFVGMYIDGINTDVAVKICEAKIKANLYPFDVLILGMGTDAHTASLFPNNPKLKQGFDPNNKELCIQIKPQDAQHTRMSLTLQAILSAKHLYLHFEGENKLTVYKKAIEEEDIYTMPIRSILHQDKKAVEVYYT